MGEVMNISVAIGAEEGPNLKAAWNAPVNSYEKTTLELKKDVKKEDQTLALSNTAEIAILAISVGPSEGVTNCTFGDNKQAVSVDKSPRIFLVQKNVLAIPDKFSIAFDTTSPKPVKVQVLIGRSK